LISNNIVLDFDAIAQEYGILSLLQIGTDAFTAQDFKIAAGRLVNSENGYYSYRDLYLELGKGDVDAGKKKISALIERNVLHFRPASKMARDLIPFPNYRVVTATGTPALRAMEIIVNPKKPE
jgi:uncharacterized protein YjbK